MTTMTVTSETYGAADFVTTARGAPILGKVVAGRNGNVYICVDVSAGESDPDTEQSGEGECERTVSLVSLSDGINRKLPKSEIRGVLKPELLTDGERLQLSQVRPPASSTGADATHAAKYLAYCFLEDGRFSGGVALNSAKSAIKYVKIQMPYQHRILLCGIDGCAALEVRDGRVRVSAPSSGPRL
jgi:hypothetical protein